MAKWGESSAVWVKARTMAGAEPNETDKAFAERVKAAEGGVLLGPSFTLKNARPATVSGRPSFVFETEDGRLFSVNREGTTIGAQVARSGLPPAGTAVRMVASVNADSPSGYQLALKAV